MLFNKNCARERERTKACSVTSIFRGAKGRGAKGGWDIIPDPAIAASNNARVKRPKPQKTGGDDYGEKKALTAGGLIGSHLDSDAANICSCDSDGAFLMELPERWTATMKANNNTKLY